MDIEHDMQQGHRRCVRADDCRRVTRSVYVFTQSLGLFTSLTIISVTPFELLPVANTGTGYPSFFSQRLPVSTGSVTRG